MHVFLAKDLKIVTADDWQEKKSYVCGMTLIFFIICDIGTPNFGKRLHPVQNTVSLSHI